MFEFTHTPDISFNKGQLYLYSKVEGKLFECHFANKTGLLNNYTVRHEF